MGVAWPQDLRRAIAGPLNATVPATVPSGSPAHVPTHRPRRDLLRSESGAVVPSTPQDLLDPSDEHVEQGDRSLAGKLLDGGVPQKLDELGKVLVTAIEKAIEKATRRPLLALLRLRAEAAGTTPS